MAKKKHPLGIELPDWMLEDPNDAPAPSSSDERYSEENRRKQEGKQDD